MIKKIVPIMILFAVLSISLGLIIAQGFYGGSGDFGSSGSQTNQANMPSISSITIIFGENSASIDYEASKLIRNSLLTDYSVKLVKDTDYRDDGVSSIISIGGSCINEISADLLALNYPICGESFTKATTVKSGQYIIKTSPMSNNRIAILAAGYEADDTWNAAEYVVEQKVSSFSTDVTHIGGTASSTPTPTPAPSPTPTLTPTPSPTPKTYTISIASFAFSQSSLTINKGDKVIWTNNDNAPHTVTSDSGSELNSDTLSTGDKYEHTFNSAGTFNYYCTIHPSMKGKVIVR